MSEPNQRMRRSMSGSALTDDVATTERAHHRGMRHSGGDITAVSGAVEMRFAINGEGHLAAENDMGGFGSMSVIWILCIWRIGPNVGMGKTFAVQLRCEPSFVLHFVQTFRESAPPKQLRPLIALNWR